MKTARIILFFLLSAYPVWAQKSVQKAADGTHNLTESLAVGTGKTLTLRAGATFDFSLGPTVTGTWALANGGTGATTAAGARTNLGLVIGTDVLAPNGSGASLTALNASQLTTGTVPLARLAGITTAELSATAGILNAQLANSAITIAGTSTALGGSITIDTITGLATTGIVKRSAANTLAIAAAGTDYVGPGAVTTSGLTQATGRLLGRTTASTGAVEEISAGTGLALSAGSLTNAGVTSITGTANQVTASASTGDVTLSLPQNIHTAATPSFASISLNNGTSPFFTATQGSNVYTIESSGSGFQLRHNSNTLMEFGGSNDRLGIRVTSGQALYSIGVDGGADLGNASTRWRRLNVSPSGTVVGGSGSPTATEGSVTSAAKITKSVTGIADNTATTVFTVTIPNAAHSGSVEVVLTGSLGAGGAIGANEATGTIKYNFAVARTAGVNAVVVASTSYGSASASVSGGATITITAAPSAVSGAATAANTFTVNVTIARGSGASTNHTCFATAELLNANASGITIQ